MHQRHEDFATTPFPNWHGKGRPLIPICSGFSKLHAVEMESLSPSTDVNCCSVRVPLRITERGPWTIEAPCSHERTAGMIVTQHEIDLSGFHKSTRPSAAANSHVVYIELCVHGLSRSLKAPMMRPQPWRREGDLQWRLSKSESQE